MLSDHLYGASSPKNITGYPKNIMSTNIIADRLEPHNKDCDCEQCEEKCEYCNGEGKIENYTTTKDDSTGYNEVVEGTGTFRKCFNCQE